MRGSRGHKYTLYCKLASQPTSRVSGGVNIPRPCVQMLSGWLGVAAGCDDSSCGKYCGAYSYCTASGLSSFHVPKCLFVCLSLLAVHYFVFLAQYFPCLLFFVLPFREFSWDVVRCFCIAATCPCLLPIVLDNWLTLPSLFLLSTVPAYCPFSSFTVFSLVSRVLSPKLLSSVTATALSSCTAPCSHLLSPLSPCTILLHSPPVYCPCVFPLALSSSSSSYKYYSPLVLVYFPVYCSTYLLSFPCPPTIASDFVCVCECTVRMCVCVGESTCVFTAGKYMRVLTPQAILLYWPLWWLWHFMLVMSVLCCNIVGTVVIVSFCIHWEILYTLMHVYGLPLKKIYEH